jgi:probable F420-dependent oxidoreductase
VELGFGLPVSGSWATPENIRSIARDAEANGFCTLWTFQRWLATEDMAPMYRNVLDPMVALGFAAAVTTKARLGTAVVNAPFYPPVALAKQFASLDVLSSGRMDIGLGLGWEESEYAAAGLAMTQRGRRFDEWLDAFDALLTMSAQSPEGAVEFSGSYYTIPRTYFAPAPVQRPRPPILLGGSAPAALRRAGMRADGWISSSRASLEVVEAAVRAVRDAAEQAGRSRDAVRAVVRGSVRLREDGAGTGGTLTGSLDQIREGLHSYAAVGVDEVFLDLNFDPEQVGNSAADPVRALEIAAQLMPLGSESF